jgi:hypothetical protein
LQANSSNQSYISQGGDKKLSSPLEGNLAMKFLLKSGDFLSMVSNSAGGATKNIKSSTSTSVKDKDKLPTAGCIRKGSNVVMNK